MTIRAALPTGAFTPAKTFAMIELEDKSKRTAAQTNVLAQLFIDVLVTEEHSFESDVTDYPVESGGTISDNIRRKPIIVSIEGIVSNSPLDALRAVIGEARAQTPPPTPVFGPQPPPVIGPETPPLDRAQEALAFLMSIWEAGETVTLRTSLGTFRKMAMSSLNVPRSKDVGDALKFSARFQQITTVTNARTTVKGRSGGGGRKGSRNADKLDVKGFLGGAALDTGQVHWGRGIVFVGSGFQYYGGSPIIRETIIVHWSRPIKIGDPAANDEQSITNGQWYYPDGTPLDPIEVAHLKKDLARDAGRRGTNGRGDGTSIVDLEFMENQRKEKQVRDLNKLNKAKARHVEQGGLPGIINPGSSRAPLSSAPSLR
jgi:hypothetical protein